MIPVDVGRIEINNDGTVSIDGVLYNNQESVLAVYPEFYGGVLLDFMFDNEVNTFIGGSYE